MAKRWESSADLMAAIQDNAEQLTCGEVTVQEARVLVYSYRAAAKVLELELDLAKATGRLKAGDDSLPGFKFNAAPRDTVPVMRTSKPNGKRAKRATA